MEISKDEIKNIIFNINENVGKDLTNDQDLIETGILDSFMVMEIIDDLEEKYSIEFPADSIIPENFENVNAIYNTLTDLAGNKL